MIDQYDAAHREGIAAIERSREHGFRFLHLRDERGEVVGVHAERWRAGAVDIYQVYDRREAIAARYRPEDYTRGGDPLWRTRGAAADVIGELLALPPHGQPGAPQGHVRGPSELWVPDRYR